MGKTTEEKINYDHFASDYFKSKGWEPFIINVTGKAVADLIVIKENIIGIVEVKSSSEHTCDRNYDDTKNLSSLLNPNVVNYLKDARQNIWELFSNRANKFEKLYAITVACQLLRYFFEFEEIMSTYAKKMPQQNIANINNPQKSAFLIVPINRFNEAVTAMNLLQLNNFVKSYSIDETLKLSVLKIEFPVF
jgi:hypothetical protein